MAILSPLPLTADLLDGVLTKVRRGIALARMSNTADFSTGIMCDLPEKIDFELSIVRTHQGLTRNSVITEIESGGESELDYELSLRSGAESDVTGSIETSAESSSDRESDSTSGVSLDGTAETNLEMDSSSLSAGSVSLSQAQENGTASTSGGNTKTGSEGGLDTSRENNARTSNNSSSSTTNRTNTFSKASRTGKAEAECSDKCVTTNTSRNYWRLDESSGAIAQAS